MSARRTVRELDDNTLEDVRMKWKNADDKETTADNKGEDAFEEAYSPLKSQKFFLGFNWTSLLGRPVVWIAAGIAVLVILTWVVLSGGGGDSLPLNEIEKRVTLLENRLAVLDEVSRRLETLEKDKDGTQPLMKRLERLETAIAKNLNEMAEKVNRMEQQAKPVPVKEDAPKRTVAKPDGTTHTVQKGETLYGISKSYGLTVERLRKINNLSEGDSIQPGQKLRLK